MFLSEERRLRVVKLDELFCTKKIINGVMDQLPLLSKMDGNGARGAGTGVIVGSRVGGAITVG